MRAFKSILEFQNHFNTDDKCREFLEEQRWGDTPCCPFCASVNVTRLKNGKRFQCNEKECRKQFSVTVGTVAENTKVPLTKWFLAMYILSNHSKGISSLQLASWLGVTQRTAWFLNHRIREMLTDNDPTLLTEIVEVDETYVGGSDKNRHASKKKGRVDGKTMVFGAVQRQGKVKAKVITHVTKENIDETLAEFVSPDANMVTDEHKAYNNVRKTYKQHDRVNHKNKEYVRGKVHTNTIEGFWSILKRQLDGIHHSVSPEHLNRYVGEAAYRYNGRLLAQDTRFTNVLSNFNGRLTYKRLTSKI